jgi:hypothetical protein
VRLLTLIFSARNAAAKLIYPPHLTWLFSTLGVCFPRHRGIHFLQAVFEAIAIPVRTNFLIASCIFSPLLLLLECFVFAPSSLSFPAFCHASADTASSPPSTLGTTMLHSVSERCGCISSLFHGCCFCACHCRLPLLVHACSDMPPHPRLPPPLLLASDQGSLTRSSGGFETAGDSSLHTELAPSEYGKKRAAFMRPDSPVNKF